MTTIENLFALFVALWTVSSVSSTYLSCFQAFGLAVRVNAVTAVSREVQDELLVGGLVFPTYTRSGVLCVVSIAEEATVDGEIWRVTVQSGTVVIETDSLVTTG